MITINAVKCLKNYMKENKTYDRSSHNDNFFLTLPGENIIIFIITLIPLLLRLRVREKLKHSHTLTHTPENVLMTWVIF